MRIADLERDMSAVFPTGLDHASKFLYARMQELTFESLKLVPGERVLETAAGIGQDGDQLCADGYKVIQTEPSQRMMALGSPPDSRKQKLRAWSEHLPFADNSFRASFCKGSLDHFDDPRGAIAELARVTASDGRIVLSVVNMDAWGCRWLTLRDRQSGSRRAQGERRHYDVPGDHFTRYDLKLLRTHAASHLEIESIRGTSLLWGIPGWSNALDRIGSIGRARSLRWADRIAMAWPRFADVLVLTGRPRA